MSDFPGRKHDQRSTASQPRACRSESCLAARHRGGSAKRIDKEAEVRQFWNSGEQMVRENSNIRTPSPENFSDEKAVQDPVRMIGRDDEWTLRRNSILILFRDLGFNFERPKSPAFEGLIVI